MAPNYKRYLTATAAPIDAAANKKRLAANFAALPDLQATIDDMVAEGDQVVYRMTIRGTQKGPLMGIPATGKQVAVTAIEIARIQDGKYVEHWGGVDNLDLIQQLGVVISPK